MELKLKEDKLPSWVIDMVEKAYGRVSRYVNKLPEYDSIYEEFVICVIEEQTENTYNDIFEDEENYVERAFKFLNEELPYEQFKRAAVFNVLIEGGFFFEHEQEKYNIPFENVW